MMKMNEKRSRKIILLFLSSCLSPFLPKKKPDLIYRVFQDTPEEC